MLEHKKESYLINKVTLEILKVSKAGNDTWIENSKGEYINSSVDDFIRTGHWVFAEPEVDKNYSLEGDYTITTECGSTVGIGDYVCIVYEDMIDSFGVDSIFREVVNRSFSKRRNVRYFMNIEDATDYIISYKKFLTINDVLYTLHNYGFHKSHIDRIKEDLIHKFKNS